MRTLDEAVFLSFPSRVGIRAGERCLGNEATIDEFPGQKKEFLEGANKRIDLSLEYDAGAEMSRARHGRIQSIGNRIITLVLLRSSLSYTRLGENSRYGATWSRWRKVLDECKMGEYSRCLDRGSDGD